MTLAVDKEEYLGELRGRRKIYTDVDVITEDNVIQVLTDAMLLHEQNRQAIQYLLNFEKGVQPLVREKVVRTEIDIVSISNLANEISEFNLGYFWGNPIAIVQKSDKNPKGSMPKVDNQAISMLNEMYDSEYKDSKDQQLARYIEICGIGYQMVDIKRDYEDGGSAFDLLTLNPLFTFVVYSSDSYESPLLGVTYTAKDNGEKLFTCIAKDRVYIIQNQNKIVNGKKKVKNGYEFGERNGEWNPLGEVYIIEYERSFDRTGCFERQISELNALNVLESDFINDVAQTTQANWWGNDIEFPVDPVTKEVKRLEGGQWIFTHTGGGGQKPDIKALILDYNYDGILNNINSKHDRILERAFVPKQSEPGGGSTANAMSISSGWNAAEAVASKKSLVVKRSFQQRNRLALKAISKSPSVEPDSPLLDLKATDIEIRFIRQKTFDMATKVNSLATMINNFVHPRVAMETIDLFSNLAEAVNDSVDNMIKYQELKLESLEKPEPTETEEPETPSDNVEAISSAETRMMADLSDQSTNSPLIG